MKASQCFWCIYYVGAVPKGNQLYGMTDLSLIFLSMMAAPDFHTNEFKIFVWTLVDSDQALMGVPPELVRNRTRLFVLYASSPDSGRWNRLHKTVRPITVVMNPWTWTEMLRACVSTPYKIHPTDHIV